MPASPVVLIHSSPKTRSPSSRPGSAPRHLSFASRCSSREEKTKPFGEVSHMGNSHRCDTSLLPPPCFRHACHTTCLPATPACDSCLLYPVLSCRGTDMAGSSGLGIKKIERGEKKRKRGIIHQMEKRSSSPSYALLFPQSNVIKPPP